MIVRHSLVQPASTIPDESTFVIAALLSVGGRS